MMLTEVRN